MPLDVVGGVVDPGAGFAFDLEDEFVVDSRGDGVEPDVFGGEAGLPRRGLEGVAKFGDSIGVAGAGAMIDREAFVLEVVDPMIAFDMNEVLAVGGKAEAGKDVVVPFDLDAPDDLQCLDGADFDDAWLGQFAEEKIAAWNAVNADRGRRRPAGSRGLDGGGFERGEKQGQQTQAGAAEPVGQSARGHRMKRTKRRSRRRQGEFGGNTAKERFY